MYFPFAKDEAGQKAPYKIEKMKYYLIAGEPSGDLHGANLIRGLQKADPGAEFRFWGGDCMAAAGGAENSPATGLVPYGIPDSGETEDDFRTTGGELCAIDEEGMSARATQAQEELTYAGYYSTSMFPPVELLYVTGTENGAVASALQNMWSTTLGVNVMLRGVTQAEYNTRMEAGNYELALQKVTALYDDAMGFLDRWCSEDEQNLISYENGTYDVLMGVARASEDPVARTAFLHDAETMLLGETALSPVYFDGTAHMLRDTLRGVYTDGFGNSYFAGVRANTD